MSHPALFGGWSLNLIAEAQYEARKTKRLTELRNQASSPAHARARGRRLQPEEVFPLKARDKPVVTGCAQALAVTERLGLLCAAKLAAVPLRPTGPARPGIGERHLAGSFEPHAVPVVIEVRI
jgi:hypothetical protein